MKFVNHFFELNKHIIKTLQGMKPRFGYNGFGEFLFYRTYSRKKADGSPESWHDTVIRVMNGLFSIRKDWYIRNHIPWDESFWQEYAERVAISMFKMEWLPPGRGLWAMGSDYVYERGAMALYNCAYTDIGDDIGDSVSWAMDSLMNGVGVGFGPIRNDRLRTYQPLSGNSKIHIIPDTREGWCESVQILIESFLKPDSCNYVFDYTQIRGKGLPIKGFGGLASGPEPLMQLHADICVYFEMYQRDPNYDSVMLKTDILNAVGCCVVVGNVRRSAEIALGEISDPVFMDLKDYDKYSYREGIGWMSNNSVYLRKADDFERLGEISQRVKSKGEPGYINMVNFPRGRLGHNDNDIKVDRATGINPCGEIPLESREVCNLAETFPTNCKDHNHWLRACEYATFYCSTVTLLPTHQQSTNAIIARNRRIGVGIVDFTGWKHTDGVHKVTRYLREGYKTVRSVNKWLAGEAGIPESIRVTTMKPGGTVPKLVGKTSGCGYPTFHHTKRRVRVQEGSPVANMLHDAGYQSEPDYYSKNTLVFSFPILQGPAKPSAEVSLWEQAFNLILLQREWADNAVSNTLYFRPAWPLTAVYPFETTSVYDLDTVWRIETTDDVIELNRNEYRIEQGIDKATGKEVYKVYGYDKSHEEDNISDVISMIAPHTKSVSLLPHTAKGVYPQMPEEGITPEEYRDMLENVEEIDWTQLRDSDGQDEKYCDGDRCEVPAAS